MGWTQTRDAPTQREHNVDGADASLETIDIPVSFNESAPIRTAFAMNDELLRHGLIHVVTQGVGIRLVGDLAHGPGLVERLRVLRPELVFVGAEAGPDLPSLVAELDPAPKIMAVIDGDDPRERALPLVRAGADAVIDRRSSMADLRSAVLRVIQGHRALDARSAETLMFELREQARPGESGTLTRREREVVGLLIEGLDNRAIAGALFISQATVKFHLHNIKSKFGVHSRAALVAAVLRGRRNA
ncbi:DNA-binding response regulator [Mycolicibacterium sp. P9-22]|nr:DNA-binding response regulator [Mycolicibacterium sp. P9-22]